LGVTWTDRDSIVFQPGPGRGQGVLFEVSANGGEAVAVTTQGENGGLQLWPQALPGGNAVVFTVLTAPGPSAISQARIVVQRLPRGEQHVVRQGGHYARYVESGHLLYMSNGTLFAAPFDLKTLSVTGAAVPAVEQVSWDTLGGSAQFAVSRHGTLVFTPGVAQQTDFGALSWLDRTGTVTPLKVFPGVWGMPRFAPDGRRLAITRAGDGGNLDIWTYDLERDTLTRITLDSANDMGPVWTPDGRRIVFGSTRGQPNASNLYWQRADGTGEAQRLTTDTEHPQLPSSWHPTRPLLAFHDGNPPGAQRVMLLELEGNEATGWKPKPPTEFIAGAYRNVMPMFSPDGRWLAYLSNKSGQFELYVRPFPGPGDEVQISSGGANDPRWSAARREILYSTIGQSPFGQIMVAPYAVDGNTFKPEKPRLWSSRSIVTPPLQMYGHFLDMHPDGQRLAASVAPEVRSSNGQDQPALVVFVLNFFEELRRRLPGAR
jgi:hypothetical protein